jgi:hypothetical protein
MITDALHDCMAAGSTDLNVGPLVPRGPYALSDQSPESIDMSSVLMLGLVAPTNRDTQRAVQFQVGTTRQEPAARS